MTAPKEDTLEAQDDRKFQVQCDAGYRGMFRTGSEVLSVTVGQRLQMQGAEEVFESVVIHCTQKDEELEVRVLVNHPDWHEPKIAARIISTIGKNSTPGLSVEMNGNKQA